MLYHHYIYIYIYITIYPSCTMYSMCTMIHNHPPSSTIFHHPPPSISIRWGVTFALSLNGCIWVDDRFWCFKRAWAFTPSRPDPPSTWEISKSLKRMLLSRIHQPHTSSAKSTSSLVQATPSPSLSSQAWEKAPLTDYTDSEFQADQQLLSTIVWGSAT